MGDWRVDAEVHEVKDHSIGAFRRQLSESLHHLNGQLDIYQVHSVTVDGPVLTDPHLHRALAVLRDRGTRVELSTSGPGQDEVVRGACDVQVDGSPLFAVVQSTWNLLEQSAGDALADATSRGLEVVVKECLANGRLAGESYATEELARRLDDSLGPDQLAVAAALAQPWATRVLVGAVTVDQVRRSLGSASETIVGRIDPGWVVEAA